MQNPKIAMIGMPSHVVQLIRQNTSTQSDYLLIPLPSSQMVGDFHAVLVHHNPPTQNGLLQLQEIKSIYPNLQIILLASNPSRQEIIQAFKFGASDFLFLPLDPKALYKCLHNLQLKAQSQPHKKWWRKLLGFLFPFKFRRTRTYYDSSILNKKLDSGHSDFEYLPASYPDFQVQFLGPFTPVMHNKPLPRFPGKKVKALLAYLLFRYPKPVHREILIDRFWDDLSAENARNCLNVTMYATRKVIEESSPGESVICYKDDAYYINPEFEVERDIDLVEKYWKEARQVEKKMGMNAAINIYYQAFGLIQGDFLEDLPYEEWAEREREKYQEIWLVILDRLSVHFMTKEKFDICLNLCQQMLSKDPCIDEVHRRLMKCYENLGMRDKAIRQFKKCSVVLKEELNIEPSSETKQLYHNIMAN